MLSLFVIILWRGTLGCNARARDSFGSYLAFGLVFAMAMQAAFNTGVVLGVVPAKGITLPLVSYGGSSLIVSMFIVGVVLSVAPRSTAPSPAGRVLINAVGAKRRENDVP